MTERTPLEGELILYRTAHDAVRVEALYDYETFWLDQRHMAELFGVDIRTVSYHMKQIYASGELTPKSTLRKIWRVQREGHRDVRREIAFYNLDAIISLGYRINTPQATRFRIWATHSLRAFIDKAFILDIERLKQTKRFGTSHRHKFHVRRRSQRGHKKPQR